MFGISNKVAIAEFIAILLMMVGGYVYYHFSQQEIMTLHETNAKLTVAVETQKITIAAQIEAAKIQNAAMLALQQSNNDSENVRRQLEGKLRKHDLAAIARGNSAALESRMNRATKKAFLDIETLTDPTTKIAPVLPPTGEKK